MTKKNLRDPPAYQEYPAAMLSSLAFRLIPLQARGLLYTMRLECWVNRRLPSAPDELAIVLGVDADDVRALLPKVMPFFATDDGGLFSPELEAYRQNVLASREAMSAAGKRGAEKKRAKHEERIAAGRQGMHKGTHKGTRKGTHQGAARVLIQNSTEQIKTEQRSNQGQGDEVDLSQPAWEDDDVAEEEF